MAVYAFVVLYSLFLGGIDLVIPVKSTFAAIIFVVIFKAIGDTSVAWRSRRYNLPQLMEGLAFLAIEIIIAAASFSVVFIFLSEPLSNINLTGESFEVRGLTAIGAGVLLYFTGNQINGLLRLKVRQKVTLPSGAKR
jgi:hypothetical protein